MDEMRFASAAKAANTSAAVVVAGDLVNVWNSPTQIGGFDTVWPTMFDRGRVHLIPGNHDVNSMEKNATVFKTMLRHYHASFGVDYHSFRTEFATFVMINSESLIAPHLGLNGTTDPWVLNQSETQWAWLDTTLAAASSGARPHTVLVTHHPPFLKSPTEKHLYWNWPLGIRKRLLGLLTTYGVHYVLAGHTHTTTSHTFGAPLNLTIYTVAGTARAFDNNGCGYRVLHINATSIDVEYVRQDDPTLKQCTRARTTLIHPAFADRPELARTWANVSWLLN